MTLFSSISAVATYVLLKNQINKLLKIHNLEENLPTEQNLQGEDDGLNTARTDASS